MRLLWSRGNATKIKGTPPPIILFRLDLIYDVCNFILEGRCEIDLFGKRRYRCNKLSIWLGLITADIFPPLFQLSTHLDIGEEFGWNVWLFLISVAKISTENCFSILFLYNFSNRNEDPWSVLDCSVPVFRNLPRTGIMVVSFIQINYLN